MAAYIVTIFIIGGICVMLVSRHLDVSLVLPYELKVESAISNNDPDVSLYTEVKEYLDEERFYRLYDDSHLGKLKGLNIKLGNVTLSDGV